MVVKVRKGGKFYETKYCTQIRLCAELRRIWNTLPKHIWSVIEKDTMLVDIVVLNVPYFLVSLSRFVRLQPSPQSITLPHSTYILNFFVKKVA